MVYTIELISTLKTLGTIIVGAHYLPTNSNLTSEVHFVGYSNCVYLKDFQPRGRRHNKRDWGLHIIFSIMEYIVNPTIGLSTVQYKSHSVQIKASVIGYCISIELNIVCI